MAHTIDRADFPLLKNGIAYLDNAATTHKPAVVLDAERSFYEQRNANVHRGVHQLAEAATTAYEDSRRAVAKYLGCKEDEVIFTSGTTHAMNLAARILEHTLGPGDEILTTIAEHHSTFLPFQQLAARKGARLVVAPLTEGTVTEKGISNLVTPRTKIIAISQVSNVLGYVLDPKKIKKNKAVLVLDAAQGVVHHPVKLGDADFIAFSGHKAYGPMGIGVLAGKRKLLQTGEPLLYGGSMIQAVLVENSTWATPPTRYEAGTPNVAGAVGLVAAIAYYQDRQKDAAKKEEALLAKALPIIARYGTVLGPIKGRSGIISFTMDRVHGHDVAQILDSVGVAVRAGHHCCQPLHDSLGIEASIRVSLAPYNTTEELDRLEEGLRRVRSVFP